MGKRNHLCDIPGCGRQRLRYQRLCPHCFGKLPSNMRLGLIAAWNENRLPDWRRLKREAGKFIEGLQHADQRRRSGKSQYVSAQRAFAMQARMLGERYER